MPLFFDANKSKVIFLCVALFPTLVEFWWDVKKRPKVARQTGSLIYAAAIVNLGSLPAGN